MNHEYSMCPEYSMYSTDPNPFARDMSRDPKDTDAEELKKICAGYLGDRIGLKSNLMRERMSVSYSPRM